jgi:hypothetical protein
MLTYLITWSVAGTGSHEWQPAMGPMQADHQTKPLQELGTEKGNGSEVERLKTCEQMDRKTIKYAEIITQSKRRRKGFTMKYLIMCRISCMTSFYSGWKF